MDESEDIIEERSLREVNDLLNQPELDEYYIRVVDNNGIEGDIHLDEENENESFRNEEYGSNARDNVGGNENDDDDNNNSNDDDDDDDDDNNNNSDDDDDDDNNNHYHYHCYYSSMLHYLFAPFVKVKSSHSLS